MDTLLLRRRMMMQKNGGILPAGYTEYEWLKCDGVAYIDTGLTLPNGYRITTRLQMWQQYYNYQMIAGAENHNQPKMRRHIGWGISPTSGYIGINNYVTGAIDFAVEQTYDYEASCISGNGFIRLNGITQMVNTAAQGQGTPDGNVYLFCLNLGNPSQLPNYHSKLRVTTMRIYNDMSQLVRHYIPCTNPNSEAGFFDLVSGSFYGNANSTGQFTVENN